MSKNCEGKTTSGDYLLEGNVVIGGSLTVEESITTQQLNVVTEHVTNLDATNAVIDTSNTTTANIGTSNTNLAGINTSNTTTANINTGNINTANVTNGDITYLTGNTGNVYHFQTSDFTINSSAFTFNSMPFHYETGSWSPVVTMLNSDANGNQHDLIPLYRSNGGTVTTFGEDGYFIRTGDMITLMFNVSYNFVGGALGSLGDAIMAIRNIPYPVSDISSTNTYATEIELKNTQFASGLAGALGAPYVATFPPPYQLATIENGFVDNLTTYAYPLGVLTTTFLGNHTFDGYQLPLYCEIEFFVPAVGVPPVVLDATKYGYVTNHWCGGSSFNVQFTGQITYFTA